MWKAPFFFILWHFVLNSAKKIKAELRNEILTVKSELQKLKSTIDKQRLQADIKNLEEAARRGMIC